MTTHEDVARQHLSLAVDNTKYRAIPLPTPWYERWHWLIALALMSLGVSWLFAVIALVLE